MNKKGQTNKHWEKDGETEIYKQWSKLSSKQTSRQLGKLQACTGGKQAISRIEASWQAIKQVDTHYPMEQSRVETSLSLSNQTTRKKANKQTIKENKEKERIQLMLNWWMKKQNEGGKKKIKQFQLLFIIVLFVTCLTIQSWNASSVTLVIISMKLTTTLFDACTI